MENLFSFQSNNIPETMNALKKRYSWVADMENTPQDSIHHAEGNVFIHTTMVLEALIKLPEFTSLNKNLQNVLLASALFHDVEKRSTTKEEDGRIVSPGHAKRGEVTTRGILYRNFDISFSDREQITKLVRHHGLPLWIFDKINPQQSIVESSLISNNYLLEIIAKADAIGRTCTDVNELLYRIELFKEYAKEQQCYNSARKFPNSFSQFYFFEKENTALDSEYYNDCKRKVIVMSGIPGTGKDYFIEKNYDLPIVSLDNIRRKHKIDPNDKYANGYVVQLGKEEARTYLRKDEPFIWNATNVTKQVRQQTLSLFRDYNAYVILNYLEVPYSVLKYQNENREYPVPSDILERFIDKLEMPSVIEAHEVNYYHSGVKQNINTIHEVEPSY